MDLTFREYAIAEIVVTPWSEPQTMVISEIYNMQPMPDPPNPMSQATPALLEM